MTTPARLAEAEEVSIAFQVALSQLGTEAVLDALALWQEVPVNNVDTTAARWLDRVVDLILFRRRQSRALGLGYYRLIRALRTGSTIADPYAVPKSVTLAALRAEFAALVAEQLQRDPGDISGEGDDEEVPVEELPDLTERLDETERAARAEAEEVLKALGTDNLGKKLKKVKDDQPAKDADTERDTAHDEAGSRQAAAAARIAMNGARSAVWESSQKDRKVLGWARVSETGSPCGWCGMLISRGAVYRSKNSATTKDGAVSNFGDGDKYHDNCKCYAEPMFSTQQYDLDPRFDLNRELEQLWADKIKGKYSGNDALNAFRTLLRHRYKAQAQEAGASTNTAQEA